MSSTQIYDFLRALSANNSKRWMDAHRDRYEVAKQSWIETCEGLLKPLAGADDLYKGIEAKNTIERINNNLLYHPDKPTYKDRGREKTVLVGAREGTCTYKSRLLSY